MNNKPLIKIFETNKRYYMYDTNKNNVVNITKDQYLLLDKCIKNNLDDYIHAEETKVLRERGYLSSNRVKEIVHSADELLEFYLNDNMQMITLQMTQQCNFRCEYCPYSGGYVNREHSNKKMSLSIAFKGIDFIINHSKNSKSIAIGFYGGEPLIEFKAIKKCIEYAEKKAEGKIVHFTMTTNGSLLNDEIIEFLSEHNVNLIISLDGPEEIQNIHRKLAINNKGSFEKVIKNIINLKERYPDFFAKIKFNSVIDPQNSFSVIDDFFNNDELVKDIPVTASIVSENYSKSEITVPESFYSKSEYELFKIYYYSLIRRKSVKNCSRIMYSGYNRSLSFGKNLIPQDKLPEKMHHSGPCIPGVRKLFIDTEGFFYPCEKVSESSELMKIGHIDTGFDVNKVRKLLNIGKVNDAACKNCWNIKFCSICPAILDTAEDEFSIRKKEECCKISKKTTTDNLITYCFLKEFNCNFNSDEQI